MGTPLRVLIIEDNERDAALIVRELVRGGYDLAYECVETEPAMAEALARQTWDLVLSDYALPSFSALAALRMVAASGLDLPLIVVSGSVGEEAAVEVMREGACDFLFKDKLTRMFPVIERELREAARRAQHREIQARMRQMEKMDALGQMTGGIAHDFNNILAVIIGMTELAAASAAGNPKLAAMLAQIDESAERGAQLVQRLLTFARKQPLQAVVLDLNQSVERAVGMLERTLGEDIRLECKLAPDLWPATADPSQVEHAILNLAVNARDAMQGGGHLLIETANVSLDEDYAAGNAGVTPGDYCCVVVTDSGTGMPREVAERAFEPFFTTKEVGRGTGLGLSMVYGFVKQSGGHVKIYSEVGHGTSIRIYLPRAAASADAVAGAGAPESAGAAPTGAIVLVVEDDPAVRNMAVSTLEHLGYRVREAPDGRTALDILRGGDPVDLLFTDMVMPNGISGQDLILAARQLRPSIKTLLTSGYSEQFLKQAVCGVRLINKPYRRETLSTAVREALARG
jgi:signal transduction histidine kinase